MEGVDRAQSTLFPAPLDDYLSDDNPVRAVDVFFVDGLDLNELGFAGVHSAHTLKTASAYDPEGARSLRAISKADRILGNQTTTGENRDSRLNGLGSPQVSFVVSAPLASLKRL